MRLSPDVQPTHLMGCAGDDQTGRCAACYWLWRRAAEMVAWQRWYALVTFHPRDSYRPAGMGQG